MTDIFDQITAPVPRQDIFDQIAPEGDAFDQVAPAATHEDVMQAAGSEVLRQNMVRRKRGLPDMNPDESGAIMDAYKLLGRNQPDKLRGQIAAETANRTQIARGVLGDAGAGAFQALTNYVPAIAGLVDPETGLRLKQGQAITANVNPASITGQFAGMGVGLAKFALEGPVAIAEAAVGGAGEQRLAVAEARKQGREISGTAEALETGARGIVDGVLARMFMKTGGRASQVVRSLIQPSVKRALAEQGINTARKLAWTWAMDSLKVGALSEAQYLADVGLGHLADPNVVPTAAEAAKAAAFGIILPSAMGAIHGLGGRLRGEKAPAPPLTPNQAGPTVEGTENYPIPPLVRSGGPLATIPGETPRPGYLVTPPPGGPERMYPGRSGPDTPRQITPFPPEGSIRVPQIVELIQNAPPRGEAPLPEAHPAGREPEIVPQTTVPATGGTGASPEKVYISKALPQTLDIDGKPVDVHRFVALHETTERELLDAGESYDDAHAQANAIEHDALRRAGVNPASYEKALAPYERTASKEPVAEAPADLDKRPYETPKPVLPRPAAVVTTEADIHRTPEGHTAATPHISYKIADTQSPRTAAEGGARPLDAAGDNLWVRPSGEESNANRTLLVQFSTHLINGERPRTSTDDYSDKIYSQRPGYVRPTDFWELPQWIGVAAHNKPRSDVYVVRNMAEAAKFLAETKYGEIAFSALDVNARFIEQLLQGYKGKVAIGGYTDMARFKGLPNVTTFDKMGDWIGPKFKDGTDYRHFRQTETQPRLQLSSGCLHKCGFCSMPRTIVKTTPEGVAQQIKSFGDLNFKLVYLNDKTFGQADNYTDLPKIKDQILKANPNFEGFIIQTTAAQMKKFPPDFLAKSGIKYVELGVESYNNSILKPLHKPASEKLIDEATQVIRENGMKLIPNILVGLPDETAQTYQNTMNFLERNKDVISHVNVNNLAAYSGTELTAKIGKTVAGDVDQNVTARSFHKDPALHEAAYKAFTEFGQKALDVPALVDTAAKTPGLLGKILGDETGAVDPKAILNMVGGSDIAAAGKQAVETITSAAADLQRTFSPGSRGTQAKQTVAEMRQENSRAARAQDIRYRAYDGARRAFDVYTRTHGQQAVDDFMDRINRGEKQADPVLQKIADTMDAERRDKVKQMEALGTGATEKFDDNWFGRQWKNPAQAQVFFRSRRPYTGPKTFLKGRTLESVAEGRAAGLELVTDNPIEMHIMKMGEMDKYIAGVNVIHALETNGAAMRVESGDAVNPGWTRIHESIGLYRARNPVTGAVEKGSYYAPEEVATLINNHLSPGLRGKAWFRTYLGAANWMNQFQLGMSGFHLAFTSADAIVSKLALALRREANYGDLGGAIKDLLGAPLAPVTNAIRGHKGLKEWFKPGSQGRETGEIIGILEDAGARVQSDPFYRTHVTDKVMKAWRQGNVLGALGRALLLPVELPTRFIMDVVVPRQKLGVAMDIVRMEMKNHPGISRDALVAKARSAWDSADNRMGQLVYDNLFWNRMTKDIAMATVRSVGWNLGTFREVGGGVVDIFRGFGSIVRGKKPDLTNRAAYVVALPTITAAIGSLLTYAFTGQAPQSLRDAIFPRTGSVDDKGNPQRVSLPTYMKDLYHFGHEPIKTLENKVHPALQLIHEMLINKDFYGTAIRNEDDPFVQQVKQEALHVLGSLEPLSSRNLRRSLDQGKSLGEASESFLGITPAPQALNETAAERVASHILQEKIPAGARTQEAAAKSHLSHDLQRQLRQGNVTAFSDAIAQGKISKDQAREIVRDSQQRGLDTYLPHLSAAEALKVWSAATPEEKSQIRTPLLKKLRDFRARATPDEFNAVATQYQQQGVFQ